MLPRIPHQNNPGEVCGSWRSVTAARPSKRVEAQARGHALLIDRHAGHVQRHLPLDRRIVDIEHLHDAHAGADAAACRLDPLRERTPHVVDGKLGLRRLAGVIVGEPGVEAERDIVVALDRAPDACR